MLSFDGQVIVITGAGRGIGRQHALFLAGRGARIVVNDYGGDLYGTGGNNPQPAEQVAADIRAAGREAFAHCSDIADAAQVRALFTETLTRYGRIDAVIHNASTFTELGDFETARVDDLERILRVNVTGGWNVAQAAWGPMRKQGYGRIVMTGSGAGFFGRRRDQAYSVAKGALMTLTKVLASEGERLGIKTNLVGPVSFTDNARRQGIPLLIQRLAKVDTRGPWSRCCGSIFCNSGSTFRTQA